MYERNTAADAGLEAFSRLLTERTGYPRRGSLADMERVSNIPGPMLGRYCRGENRPTDENLRKLAPALGMTFEDLWKVLNPDAVAASAVPAPPPDPNQIFRLSTLLDEAQKIINSLRRQQVDSVIASERRKGSKQTRMDSNQPYDRQGVYQLQPSMAQ